jgi:hypothetical protein
MTDQQLRTATMVNVAWSMLTVQAVLAMGYNQPSAESQLIV